MDFRQRAASTALDFVAVQIVPQIGGVYSEPFWTVAHITKRMGAEPSSLLIEVPTSGWGGKAPLIAGVQGGGPLANAKNFKRVTALLNGAVLFNGCVVVPDEDFDRDGATVECLDDRYLLEGVNVVGSFWIEDQGSSVCYQQGIPAWFNKDGLPNRIHGESGLTYAFCDSNYGIRPGEQPSDPKQNSADVCTHWTPDSIMVYLAETTNKTIVGTLVSAFKEYTFVPDSVVFPKGLGTALVEFTANTESPPIGLRKAAEIIFDATPLNQAIQKLCEMAGPFAMGLDHGANDKSTITIVQSRYAGGGKSLQRATGKDVDAFDRAGKVIGGGIKRDGRKLCTQSIVSGDLQYVESRVASTDRASIEEQLNTGVELITAFDPATLDIIIRDFNIAVDAGLNPKLEEFITQYPLALESWRLNPNKNFAKGTSEADKPWCVTSNRKILPHMLTTFIVKAEGKGTKPFELKTGFQAYWLEFAETTTTDVPAGPGSVQAAPTGGENGNTPAAPGDATPSGANAADYAGAIDPSDWGTGNAQGDQSGGNEE